MATHTLLQRSSAPPRPAQASSAVRSLTAGRDLPTARAMLNVARDGLSGTGMDMPHRDTIQRSFGRHDISGIVAHGDGHAKSASRALGASAFALGNSIGFGETPNLHTAAHEAAHVIQQRSGLQLAGGIGGIRDAHERHADAVADRVVRGQSAEALLDQYAGRGGGNGDMLQRKAVDSAYGKFDTVDYHPLTDDAGKGIGCEIWIRFAPGDKVDSTNIGLVQAVKPTKEGALDAVADKEKQAVPSGKGKGFYVDKWADSANPVYGSKPPAANADNMANWTQSDHIVQKPKGTAKPGEENYNGLSQMGFRRQKGDGSWDVQTAQLTDTPMRSGSVGTRNSGQRFETTALSLAGKQKGAYYGSVEWGWERNAAGNFKLLDFKPVSMGTPSANFQAAATQWNKSTTWNAGVAGGPTLHLPVVDVWVLTTDTKAQIDGAEKVLPEKITRVRRVAKGATAADPWTVEIVDGPDTGKRTTLPPAVLKREL